MKNKLFLLIFFTLAFFGLTSGSIVFASSGTCARDDGHGVICSGDDPYYCLNTCMSPTHCPNWSGTGICANGVTCPANCSGTDSCGYCNQCASGYILCGSYPNQQCKPGSSCVDATLQLSSSSVGAGGYIFQSTAPALTLDNSNILSLIDKGKFGIGTSRPNKQLHVYNIKENAEIDIQSVAGENGHWGIYHDSGSDDLRFWGDGDRLTIKRNGEIVAPSLGGSGVVCLQANNDGIISKYGGSCGGAGGSLVGGQQYYIPIWNSASTMGTSTIYQGPNGNVVIGGTTSSSYKLYVSGSEYVAGSVVATGNGYFGSGNVYNSNANLHILGGKNLYLKMDYDYNDSDTNIIFAKDTTSGATPTPDNELMRITEAGKIGIGTNNPQNELHVYNTSSGPIINLEGDFSAQYQGIRIGDKDNSNEEKWFMGSNDSGNYVIRRKSSGGNSTNDFSINYSTGNIILATTTVSGPLTINTSCTGANALQTDGNGKITCVAMTGGTGGGLTGSGSANQVAIWNSNATGLTSEANLAVSRGGTGAGTFTSGGILFGNGTSAISASAVLTNGQLLIGDGSGAPTLGTLTAGSGVTITNAAGSITVAHTDPGTNTSVDNSNGSVVQDVTLDALNHVTGITSYDLDSRYFTETESDARFLKLSGGTITGSLIVNNDLTVGSGTLFAGNTNKTIGIGTTDSDALIKIQVYDATNGPIIRLKSGRSDTYKGISIFDSSATTERWFVGASSAQFVIRRGGSTNALKVDTSSNIEMSNALNVKGAISSDTLKEDQSDDSEGRCLYANNDGVIKAKTTDCGAGGGGGFWTSNGNNIYRNSGNVGIGTTNPTQKLEVNGNIKFSSVNNQIIGTDSSIDNLPGAKIEFDQYGNLIITVSSFIPYGNR